MNTYLLKGRVVKVTPAEEVKGRPRCFVHIMLHDTEDARFLGITPELYILEAFGIDAVESAQTLKEGEEVAVEYSIRCREWEGKPFVSLNYGGVIREGETFSDLTKLRAATKRRDKATHDYIRRRIGGLAEMAKSMEGKR